MATAAGLQADVAPRGTCFAPGLVVAAVGLHAHAGVRGSEMGRGCLVGGSVMLALLPATLSQVELLRRAGWGLFGRAQRLGVADVAGARCWVRVLCVGVAVRGGFALAEGAPHSATAGATAAKVAARRAGAHLAATLVDLRWPWRLRVAEAGRVRAARLGLLQRGLGVLEGRGDACCGLVEPLPKVVRVLLQNKLVLRRVRRGLATACAVGTSAGRVLRVLRGGSRGLVTAY